MASATQNSPAAIAILAAIVTRKAYDQVSIMSAHLKISLSKMGGKLPFPLLTPRPSNRKIHEATGDEAANTASNAVSLVVLDMHTGTTATFCVKRDIALNSVLHYIATQTSQYASQLEMRIEGAVVDGTSTSGGLCLEDGTRIEICRKPAEDPRRWSDWVDRNSGEKEEDESKMRAMLAQRYERKCRMARETFGWDAD